MICESSPGTGNAPREARFLARNTKILKSAIYKIDRFNTAPFWNHDARSIEIREQLVSIFRKFEKIILFGYFFELGIWVERALSIDHFFLCFK